MTAILDILVNFIVNIIAHTGYAGVLGLMTFESVGLPIPSEVIMSFAGFLVVDGKLLFWLVVLAGTAGNLFGSLLAYWIGFRGGRPLIEKYGKYILISKHDLDLADKWFAHNGELAVLVGRILPVVRTYISFPAGIAKMDLKKFSFYSFVGSLPWCILLTWLGVRLGNNWDLIRQKLHNFDLAIGLGILVLIALYVWRHIRHLKKG